LERQCKHVVAIT